MNAFDSCKLYRFDTGRQIFETVIYQNGYVHWLSLPSIDISGRSLNGNDRDIYRSLRSVFPKLKFTSAEQVHSNKVSNANSQSEFEKKKKCDGLVTADFDKALIIRTADCIPVFIFNQQQVGLLHAGHKGIQANILEKWNLYSLDQPSYLVVGDHIKSCCFKVHRDVEMKFSNLPYANNDSIVKINDSQWCVSLVKILYNQWHRLERTPEHFFDFSNCTCCNKNLYSYRRSGESLKERTGHVIFRTRVD
ncbi:MAG: polyphenol oxidase family protein [bacterium]|nr:polyphenol oxidase family protein [bacterium]